MFPALPPGFPDILFTSFFGVSYLPVSGFYGILAGFLVGIKQMIPDQELPVLKLKAKV